MDIKDEVKQALEAGQPVVALESTIISHGMPYPENVQTARRVESIVRENGAIPATIAIIKGRLKVGLTDSELEEFGKNGPSIQKTSRRDFPFVISQKIDGATTVAATMIIAQMAEIPVFVTGGIGGVHRGAQESFDISADLEELSKTNVAVVCAGAKSILDIGLTLEYLETRGVPVIGYQTKTFPAFYTRRSDFSVDYTLKTPEEMAQAIYSKWAMGLDGGVVIANPIPEEHALDENLINDAINKALSDATKKGIHGKQTTPFLLEAVKTITDGKSLKANIELVYHNAQVGAQISKALSRISKI